MTRKNWILVALALLLGAFSLYLNKDWFAKDTIQIFSRSRPPRPMPANRKRAEPAPAVNPITFGFSSDLKLTSLKVIPVSDIETNKYPHPIWHLTGFQFGSRQGIHIWLPDPGHAPGCQRGHRLSARAGR